MRYRLVVVALLVAMLATLMPTALASKAAVAVQEEPFKVPMTDTFTDALGGVGNFVGQLDVRHFDLLNGVVLAEGLLTGELRDSAGDLVGTVAEMVLLPVELSAVPGAVEEADPGLLDGLLGLVTPRVGASQ